MTFCTGKRVTVTGGAGFLGSFVVEKLQERGCRDIFVPRSREYNLVEMEAAKRLYRDARPDIVIHLAARVGGIGANRANPGRFFYDNAMMGIQLMEEGRLRGIGKFVAIGDGLFLSQIHASAIQRRGFVERLSGRDQCSLWLGQKDAPRPSAIVSRTIRVQFHFSCAGKPLPAARQLRPGDFPRDTGAHQQMLRRKDKGGRKIFCWGDGTPTREFLYVEDCAEAILLAAERYDGADPVNLGTGKEISIADLVRLIAELVGFKGGIVWETAKPNGQPRRCLDVGRARQLFGFTAKTAFREGLKKTIDWYLSVKGR